MNGWETTIDDLSMVLLRHDIEQNDDLISRLYDSLDFDKIEREVFRYDSFDSQCNAMFSEIEDQLIEKNIVADKKFEC